MLYIFLPFLFLSTCYLTLVKLQLIDFANDPGVGWHLRTGEIIAQTGIIPRTDPFLFGGGVRNWISDQWFSDFILHNLYIKGGFPLIYLALTIIFLVTFAFILPEICSGGLRSRRAQRAPTDGVIICSFLASFISFKISTIHFIFRPVIFSFFLFAILFLIVSRASDREEKIFKLKSLYFILPVLFLLWANIHPSFLVGLILISLIIISSSFDLFVRKIRTLEERELNSWIIIFVLSSLATLINPYGYKLHASIISLVDSDLFTNLNNEWKSLNFKNPESGLFEFIFMGIILAIFINRKALLSRITSFEILSLLTFAHLALGTVRMLPYFAIVSAPLLTKSLDSLIPEGYFQKEIKNYLKPVFVCLILSLFVYFFITHKILFYNGRYEPSRDKFPYASLEFLKSMQMKSGREDKTSKVGVASTPNWGGFITFFGDNRLAPIIDDRNTLLGEEIYRQYLDAIKVSGDWDSFARKYSAENLVEYSIIPSDQPLAVKLIKENSDKILFREPNGIAILVQN